LASGSVLGAARQNETDLSDLHGEKQDEQRNWQMRGIMIDSIRVNRECPSNKTDLSDLHKKNHPHERVLTFRGTRID
jgi:hypothetical protein